MLKRLTLLLALLAFPFVILHAEYEETHRGMVASRSDLASQVGSDIMAAGGNAVDAAAAVGFALAVTYPSAGNIGGGGFMVLHLAEGEVLTLDFREKAPAAAHRDMFLGESGNVDRALALSSLQASGVPGSVAGLLEAQEKYGVLERADIMAPAINLAREGFILNEDIAGQFARNLDDFSQHPASMAVFTRNGEPYNAGERWQQPDLATTLERIAAEGRDGFYKGETADLIVAEMKRNNGLITHQDLAQYEPVWREPIHGTYRGYDIWSMPPPSSGGALLIQMLNMLEPYPVGEFGWGSPETVHLMIEAERRAYADRAEYMGDPDYFDVPLDMLTSKDYAAQRFADFDPEAASRSDDIGAGSWPEESPQTTHYSIVDAAGNAVSLTTTLNRSYGNKIVVPDAGFLLNNEMDDFSSKPDTPNSYGLIGREANAIEPGKRMLSSMTPSIVSRDGKPVLITGSPGGSTIITTVFQIVVNVIDHGMDVEEAVSSPRFHHQWMPNLVRFEFGAIPDESVSTLEDMGHVGLTGSNFSIGDANSISVDGEVLKGVSDPRNVGGTAGF